MNFIPSFIPRKNKSIGIKSISQIEVGQIVDIKSEWSETWL